MSNTRPMLVAGLLGLALTVLFGVLAPLGLEARGEALDFGLAHRAASVFLFLLPALTFLHLHAIERIWGREVPARRAIAVLSAYLAGGVFLSGAILLGHGAGRMAGLALGAVGLVGAAGMSTGAVLALAPRPGDGVVRAEEPITKGDGACLKVLRFAHFFLPLGTAAALLAGPWWGWEPAWTVRASAGAMHLLLVGHGLLSVYALSHLWVPRFSGVPAIAAGAIKGELHTSLLGIVLLVPGFAFDVRALRIAGGLSLFVGMFTFMGVLGANIMKRKSPTQRVTREFSYVPWTFSGVFWLIAGILLGLFLNALPDVMAHRLPALRFVHVHAAVWGGFAQLWMGFGYRTIPAWSGQPPPTFESTKWAFYLVNLAMLLLLGGMLGAGPSGWAFRLGSASAVLGVAVYFMTLRGLLPERVSA